MVEDVLTDHEVVLSIKCVCEYVCVCVSISEWKEI